MDKGSFEREVLDRLIVLETLLKEQDYKGLSERAQSFFSTQRNAPLHNPTKYDILDLMIRKGWQICITDTISTINIPIGATST